MTSKTEAVYRKDGFLYQLDTTVQSVQSLQELSTELQALFKQPPPEARIVTTSSTIFHAQGGGQPSDTGHIRSLKGNETTFDVQASRYGVSGTILHLGTFSLQNSTFSPEENVKQEIDAEKRILHSRLHTAGHVLGLAIRSLAGSGSVPEDLAELKASHYPGAAFVDFQGLIPGTAKAAIQAKVDELVSQDLEIKIHFWSESEAKERCTAVLEGVKGDEGVVRVCEVDGAGSYPCGGTHVYRTGELGKVRVRNIKRQKGVSKVTYEVGDA